ncbi:hypothetical protein PMIN06_005186 [Paraphaeosphaeria minitans]
MNPNVQFHDIDVIVRRSTLLLLLQVAEAKDRQTFDLDLKMAGKTLFIQGKGAGRVNAAKNSYGRNFEDQFTESTEPTEDTGADGYHRVLRYKLGPLNLVVRLETDAFLNEVEAPVKESEDTTFRGKRTIDASSQHLGIPHTRATSIVAGGRYIPQSLVTELKTTNTGTEHMVKKCGSQLWASQYDTIIIGDRKSGETDQSVRLTSDERREAAEKLRLDKEEAEAGGYAMFYSANVKDIRRDCSQWEDSNQAGLQKFVGLLKGLVEAVSKVKGGKVLLRKAHRTGPLELYKGGEAMTDALPKEIIDVFWV